MKNDSFSNNPEPEKEEVNKPFFSSLQKEMMKRFSIKELNSGWDLVVPKKASFLFFAVFFLLVSLFFFAFGGVFLFLNEFTSSGNSLFLAPIFISSLVFIFSLISFLGRQHIELRDDRLVKYYSFFNIRLGSSDILLQNLLSIDLCREVDRFRGKFAGYSQFLILKTKNDEEIRIGGFAGLGGGREELKGILQSWVQKHR